MLAWDEGGLLWRYLRYWIEAGHDRAPRPCTYCNKCLINFIENPLGCYDERRYASREEMLAEIYSVFDPPPIVSSSGR